MRKRLIPLCPIFVLALLVTDKVAAQSPLGNDFTYQGQLRQSGVPGNGNFDLRFRVFDGMDPNTATLLGTNIECGLAVEEGLFAVNLNFGQIFQAGEELWLEISVFPAGDCSTFVNLSPLQPIKAAPFAHYAPENDPTVALSVKDGVSWSEVADIPEGFVDGTDDTVGGEEFDCYSTDWGDRSNCAFGPTQVYPAPVPTCNPGFVFVGLAEVGVAPTDCGNWTANVRLRVKARCCRVI